MSAIPASTSALATFVPEGFDDANIKPTIFLRIPSPRDRDTLTSRLINLGLRSYSQEEIRAHLINEIYETAPDEASGDEQTNFLVSAWQRGELFDSALGEWHERELQRQLDIAAGAPARPAEPMPADLMTPRERARQTIIVNDVMRASARMKAIAAENGEYNRRRDLLLMRIHVAGLSGDHFAGIELEAGPDGLATEDSLYAMRDRLTDSDWDALSTRIADLYTLTETERKNSDSPPAKLSGLTGSPAQSGE